MKTIYLLRHGSTDAHGKFVGATNIGVSESGFQQLAQLKDHISSLTIDSVLCSPMRRCVETVSYLQLPQPVDYIDDLREIDFGLWENKSFEDIVHEWPEEVNTWSQRSPGFTFPEGEGIADFLLRVERSANLIEQDKNTKILVVSHGGMIRHLICSFLRLAPENYLLFNVQAGHLSTLELYSEGGILTSLNQG